MLGPDAVGGAFGRAFLCVMAGTAAWRVAGNAEGENGEACGDYRLQKWMI